MNYVYHCTWGSSFEAAPSSRLISFDLLAILLLFSTEIYSLISLTTEPIIFMNSSKDSSCLCWIYSISEFRPLTVELISYSSFFR